MGAALIPLMYQPPQVKDPMTAYGQMLQLKNMQMQQQQAAQVNPLILQQQQAATQMDQIKLQQAQLQIQYQQNLNREFQDYANQSASGGAQPPAQAAPAAAPAAPPSATDGLTAAPAAAAAPVAPYAATSLATTNNPTDLTAGLSPVAAPYASLSAPPAPAPAQLAPRSLAPGQKIYPTAAASSPPGSAGLDFDPMVPLNRALQKGAIPYAYYQQAAAPIIAMRQSYAKMNSEELTAQNARDEQYYGRLQGFLKQPSDYQADNWENFNYQAYKDGVLSPSHYQSVQQHFPTLPDPGTMQHLQQELATTVGAQNWAMNDQKLRNEQLTGQKTQADVAKAQAELPGTQAKSEQEQTIDAAQALLANLDTPSGYQNAKDAIAAKNPAVAARFADAGEVFDENGVARPDQVNALKNRGMTPDQMVTTDVARIRAENTASHQAAMERLGQERNDIERNRANAPKPGTAPFYQQLATKAYNNLAQTKPNPSWDDVIASVKDQSNYKNYDTNAPEMDANRAGVIDYMQRVLKGQQGNTREQQIIDTPPGKKPGTSGLQRQPDGTWRKPLPGATTPPTQKPAAAPSPAASAQTHAPTPPVLMTEAQARAKATAAGKDPDAYVSALRSRKLLQ